MGWGGRGSELGGAELGVGGEGDGAVFGGGGERAEFGVGGGQGDRAEFGEGSGGLHPPPPPPLCPPAVSRGRIQAFWRHGVQVLQVGSAQVRTPPLRPPSDPPQVLGGGDPNPDPLPKFPPPADGGAAGSALDLPPAQLPKVKPWGGARGGVGSLGDVGPLGVWGCWGVIRGYGVIKGCGVVGGDLG